MNGARNLEIVKSLYDLAAVGDVEGIIGLFDPDIVLLEPGSLPYGGRYEGADGFRRMVAGINACWSSFFASDFEYVANGEAVMALFRFQAVSRQCGRAVDQNICELWHVKHGKIVHCEVFYFDTHQLKLSI